MDLCFLNDWILYLSYNLKLSSDLKLSYNTIIKNYLYVLFVFVDIFQLYPNIIKYVWFDKILVVDGEFGERKTRCRSSVPSLQFDCGAASQQCLIVFFCKEQCLIVDTPIIFIIGS